MNSIDSRDTNLDALKTLNSTIVTCRLYPPDAPQTATAVDRGYKALKQILRRHGPLTFLSKDDIPQMGGKELSRETLDSFPNLVVFRQLRLLGLHLMVLRPEMDRFAFGQLLSVFNASKQKIDREGGGAEYVTGLGLADFFPEHLPGEVDTGREQDEGPLPERKSVIKVRPVLVACLLGRDSRPAVLDDLKMKMLDTESSVSILVRAIGLILQEISQTRIIMASSHFPRMLLRAEKMISSHQSGPVTAGVAEMMVNTLKDNALCVLLCQEYPEGLGNLIYQEMIGLLSNERLGRILVLLREQYKKSGEEGKETVRKQELGQGLQKLMETRKGKAFLSAEKAKKIISDGERARKKSRLEVGLKKLLQGSAEPLHSSEFIAHLPGVIKQMLRNRDEESIRLILHSLIAFIEKHQRVPGDALLHSCLVTLGEIFVGLENPGFTGMLYDILVDVTKRLREPDELAERTLVLLQRLMKMSWQGGDFKRGDAILSLMHRLRTGKKTDTSALRNLVGRVQDKYIVRADLPTMLDQCLVRPEDEALSYRLIHQGPVVVRFLIDSLIKSESGPDRMKIMDLLIKSPNFLVSAVLERLPEHMPWYGKRNLLKLLGETGSEKDAAAVTGYLGHEDFRVQREALGCLQKISGKNRKKVLLKALGDSSGMIMVDIVTALRQHSDEEVAHRLNELLVERELFSEEIRNRLLREIMETLGRSSCAPALKYVQSFLVLKEQRVGRKISEDVWSAAEKAAEYLDGDLKEQRRKHIQATQLRKNALKQAAKLDRSAGAVKRITGTRQELAIGNLLSRGEKQEALDELIALIEKTAHSGNFSQAEKLREWLVEIDPTALTYIIQAAEVIDREKAVSLDSRHLDIWSELYELLSTEEFSQLFHNLQHRTYVNEEILVRQGELQPCLFFINSGRVKLFFENVGDEVLVRTLSSGDIVGAGAFFDASVWTFTVASIGSTEVSVLLLAELQRWGEEYPGLEEKLSKFCRRFEGVQEYIDKNRLERRVHKRYRVEGRISTRLLDNRGRITGVNPKGELFDISLGGAAYLQRISVKENVRRILGSGVIVELPSGSLGNETISLKGDILSLKPTYATENDYSVHVQFEKLLPPERLESIIAALKGRL